MSELTFDNLYDRPDVKRECVPQVSYPRMALTRLAIPCRMGIISCSGGGKTSWALNCLLHIGVFDTLYILAKQLQEPLYQWLIHSHQKLGIKHVFATDDLAVFDTLWSEANQDPNVQKAVVIDDMITCSARVPDSVLELFNRGRKCGWSAFFLSSSWFSIDPRVRNSIDVKVLRRINDDDVVARILHGCGLTRDAVRLYKHVVSKGYAFVIDESNPDPVYRFRANYTPINMGAIETPQLALKGLKQIKAGRQVRAPPKKPQLLIEEVAD